MRDFAPLWTVTRLFFKVLEKGYRRDARTDFDAKYVKLLSFFYNNTINNTIQSNTVNTEHS